jgi:hypothetical protein
MRIFYKLARTLLTPLEILGLRAEAAYWQQRLDELEASVEARLENMKHEFYAELRKLELRVEEAEQRNKILNLRLQALEKELRKLPGLQPQAGTPDSKIGLA